MEASDDVRIFYSQALDATQAFRYRLQKAVDSLEKGTPDYAGLTKALSYVLPSSAISIMIRDREKLIQIVSCPGTSCAARLSFLQVLMNVVKLSGDMDLIALTICSYVRESINSLLFKQEGYSSAISLLEIYRDNICISYSVRAKATLTIAEVMLECGELTQARNYVRKALRLTRKTNVLTQCFHIAGNIEMARGMYRRACRKYERAMNLGCGSVDKSVQAGTIVAQKWAIAEMKSGNTSESIVEAVELILLSQSKSKSLDVIVLFCMVLEMTKWQENQYSLRPALRLRNAIKMLSARWKDCCKLSLAIADYLIEHGQYNKSTEYLDYTIRLASQYHNPFDMVDALLLSAKAYWCQGRFIETLKVIRIIRGILWKQRPSVKLGLTKLLRAKIAFYRNAQRRTIRLSMRANELFSKNSFRESFEAVRIVAVISTWLGQPTVGIEVLNMCSKTQRKINQEPDGIVASCFVLSSTCYADNKSCDAEHWLQICRDITYAGANPKTQVVKTLMESEFYCQQHTYKDAEEAARLAIEHAGKFDHKLLQAMCHYQLIKALVMGGEDKIAQRYLNDVRCDYPYCERMMWKHVAVVIKKEKPTLSEFKPIGIFLF